MASWIKFLILTLLIGFVKAQNIRMVVLAVLGLAGLWMMQNFAASSSGRAQQPFSIGEIATRILSKRSIYDTHTKEIDWDLILQNDYSTCTRSFICQLSSVPVNQLTDEESVILKFIRQSGGNGHWASKQLQLAMENGQRLKSKARCRKVYKRCPYNSATMLSLLKMINNDGQH